MPQVDNGVYFEIMIEAVITKWKQFWLLFNNIKYIFGRIWTMLSAALAVF